MQEVVREEGVEVGFSSSFGRLDSRLSMNDIVPFSNLLGEKLKISLFTAACRRIGTYVTTDDFQYSADAVACIVGTLLDKSQMVDWIN